MLNLNQWYIVHNDSRQCKLFIDKMQAYYGSSASEWPKNLNVFAIKAEMIEDNIYFCFLGDDSIFSVYTDPKDGLQYNLLDGKQVNDFEKTEEWQEHLDEQKILSDVIKNSQPAEAVYVRKENNVENKEQQLEGVRRILDKWLEIQKKSADKILQSKSEEIIRNDPAYKITKQFCDLVNTMHKANDPYYIETTIEELTDRYNLLSMETRQKLDNARKKCDKHLNECNADGCLAYNLCQIADSGEAMMEILQKQGIIGE